MFEVLMALYLLVALALIGLVMIQQGKGADMGASFGAGGSATIFGSSGSGNFLTKTTAILATSFFVLSLLLGNLSASQVKEKSRFNDLTEQVEQVAPAEQPKETEVPK